MGLSYPGLPLHALPLGIETSPGHGSAYVHRAAVATRSLAKTQLMRIHAACMDHRLDWPVDSCVTEEMMSWIDLDLRCQAQP